MTFLYTAILASASPTG